MHFKDFIYLKGVRRNTAPGRTVPPRTAPDPKNIGGRKWPDSPSVQVRSFWGVGSSAVGLKLCISPLEALKGGVRAELFVRTPSGIVYLGHLYAGESGQFRPIIFLGPVRYGTVRGGVSSDRLKAHVPVAWIRLRCPEARTSNSNTYYVTFIKKVLWCQSNRIIGSKFMDEWRYTIYNFTPVITTCLPSIITFAMPHQAGVLCVGIFYKLRSKLPKRVLKNIYFAFVHPHILYGVEIYANTSRTHINRLMKLNNTLLRVL